MKVSALFALLTLGVALNTSAEINSDPALLLKWVEKANPTLDAKAALKNGDTRLMAIYGFALIIPGVDFNNYARYEKEYGYNPIEGTGDDLSGEEHARLNELATNYALEYNAIILGGGE